MVGLFYVLGSRLWKSQVNLFETVEEKHERALQIVDELKRIVDSRWDYAQRLLKELEDILKEPY